MGKKEELKLMNKLNSDGALFRVQGIISCAKLNEVPFQIADKLRELKADDVDIMGRPVSQYAIAALDILKIEKYTGNDQDVKDFIKYMPTWA